ncbi:MAG: hypothetical protein GXP19_05025 [Gammaproteobacteria bacterium]|nr:hypothetical protein [Gammaproteobacteria bacterium]
MTATLAADKRNDFENLVSALSIITIVVIIGLIVSLINNSALIPTVLPIQSNKLDQKRPSAQANDKKSHELQIRFDQAIALLHAKQYEFAVTALEQVLTIAPKLPEAYVNMGFALLGLKQYEIAGESFNKATQLNLEQTNAYWGLALALEGLEDYEGALGAMRSYIHLSTPDDPFLPKARAALWEWEAKLGRIPGVKEQPDGSLKNHPG